jgi:hypothetical protein
VPSGAIGVGLNERVPLSALWAERSGLRRHGCIMSRMMLLCIVSQHQWAIGKDGGMPAMPTVK